MKFIPNSVTQSVAKKVYTAKKNSPHIFFAGGVIGVVGSTVMACRATLKLEPVLDEIKHDVDQVKEMANSDTRNPEYTDEDYYKDLGFVYGKSIFKMGKLYGPSAAVGAISIAALTGSHIQLTRRNAALSAAFAAISKAYDEYRVRVQDEIGEERELEIYRGIEEETVKIDGKNEKVQVVKGRNFSPYARIFEPSNKNWKNHNEYNRMFLSAQEKYANDRLKAKGYLFLNEVYDSLGMEWSEAGQIVGWRVDGDGDCYVDFGIFEAYNKEFINGHEPCVWLDFNVDGPIHDCAF